MKTAWMASEELLERARDLFGDNVTAAYVVAPSEIGEDHQVTQKNLVEARASFLRLNAENGEGIRFSYSPLILVFKTTDGNEKFVELRASDVGLLSPPSKVVRRIIKEYF